MGGERVCVCVKAKYFEKYFQELFPIETFFSRKNIIHVKRWMALNLIALHIYSVIISFFSIGIFGGFFFSFLFFHFNLRGFFCLAQMICLSLKKWNKIKFKKKKKKWTTKMRFETHNRQTPKNDRQLYLHVVFFFYF